MNYAKEYPISTSLPFLKDGSVLYVSNGENAAFDGYIGDSCEFLSDMLSCRGYSFLSLRELFGELSEDLLAYLFPGVDATDFSSVQGRIQKVLFGDSTHSGFIRNDSGRLLFCDLSELYSGDDPVAAVDSYLLLVGDRSRNEIRFSITSDPMPGSLLFEESEEVCESSVRKPRKSAKKSGGIRYKKYDGNLLEKSIGSLFDEIDEERKEDSGVMFSKVAREETEPETPLDERAQAIIAELERIQKKYNVSIEEFEGFLVQRVQLSHMHITPAGKIILTDFDNKEVKIDDLSKAVFFLYLKHPEGISYYDLDSYRSELMDLYMGITGKDDREAIDRSINSLVNRFDNSINVKVSRVKSAFRSVVSDRVAKFYYIDGPQGGVKKIPIDRDYVIWEH